MPYDIHPELERIRAINLIETKSLHIEKDALIGLINESGLIDEEIPDDADFVFDEETGIYSREEVRIEWNQNLTDRKREALDS